MVVVEQQRHQAVARGHNITGKPYSSLLLLNINVFFGYYANMSNLDEQNYSDTEEIEIEVTDDENEEDYAENSAAQPETPSKSGRVEPSTEVKNMEMKSPESVAKTVNKGLSPEKNPFPYYGRWTKDTLSEISIEVPILSSQNETTNALTKQNNPENRYWKGPIVFRYGAFTSTSIRFDNVQIPYHTAEGYGSSFVYMCLPGYAQNIFADACKTRRPTKVTENSLVHDDNRWWKIANNVSESFGFINKTTNKFHKTSLEAIFESTRTGITANVVLNFKFKANTVSSPLKPTTPGTLSIELDRGYISTIDVAVQMPTRISKKKVKVEPMATSGDVASDSLMKRLSQLGL